MANRFTDSRKWDDPWFRKLPCKYKVFFIFLIDKCNHAGIWKVDFESASFHIGETLDKDEVIKIMNGRIIELKEKWFIPKFIDFQYQVSVENLNPGNRVHQSVLSLLTKEGLIKGLVSPFQGCKDKDYNKDKDKDKDRGMVIPTLEEVIEYCKERNNGVDSNKWFNFYSAKGWLIGKNKMKDWKAAVRTWEKKDVDHTGTTVRRPL